MEDCSAKDRSNDVKHVGALLKECCANAFGCFKLATHNLMGNMLQIQRVGADRVGFFFLKA